MLFLGPDSKEQLKTVSTFGAIGIELGLAIVVGYFGGRWLDSKFETAPWLRWIGFFLGLAAGFKSLYQLTRKARAELDNDDNTP